jgi:hypothetical protein
MPPTVWRRRGKIFNHPRRFRVLSRDTPIPVQSMGTISNMSIAAMSGRWFCRKLRQVGEGALGRQGRYPTVTADDALTARADVKAMRRVVRKTFLRNHADGIASSQRSTDATTPSPAVAAEKSTPS